MKTDKDTLDEWFRLTENNLDTLSMLADGNFVDPKTRPKKKRTTWTKASYEKEIMENLTYWRDSKIPVQKKMRHLFGLRDYVLAALDGQYQRFRDVAMLLRIRPIDESIDKAKRAMRKKIKEDQKDMEPFNRRMLCSECGLPMFKRDENNNYIWPDKSKVKVCTHPRGKKARAMLKVTREEIRREQERKKRIPKKDPMRYKK